MSDEYQTKPIMDGADDATDEEKRAGIAEQVDHDRTANPSSDPSAERSDELHERLDEADVEPGDRA